MQKINFLVWLKKKKIYVSTEARKTWPKCGFFFFFFVLFVCLFFHEQQTFQIWVGHNFARGGGVPFWRWRVCKAQKTPFFSIAVTHRPHIFYSCMSSHPKTHIFSFNLSLNAPWFEKLVFEKNTSIDHNEIKHESNVAWGFLAYSLLYNPGD